MKKTHASFIWLRAASDHAHDLLVHQPLTPTLFIKYVLYHIFYIRWRSLSSKMFPKMLLYTYSSPVIFACFIFVFTFHSA